VTPLKTLQKILCILLTLGMLPALSIPGAAAMEETAATENVLMAADLNELEDLISQEDIHAPADEDSATETENTAETENITTETEDSAPTLSAIGTAGTWNSCDVKLEGTLRYDYAFEVLEIENQRRVSLGLTPLVMDKDLMDHAMTRAIQTAMHWDHVQPDGASFGYGSAVYMNAEIIACIYKTPSAATNGWYNSASHYPEIIGKRYTGTGVGVFVINGNYFWVQLFNMLTPTPAYESDYPASTSVSRTIAVTDDNIYNHTTVSLSDRTLDLGQTAQFSVDFAKYTASATLYYDLPASGLVYDCSDESVCTVNENGVVTAVGGGTATIKARYPRYDYSPWTFTVTVSVPSHTCNYTGQITTQPGCETAGVQTFTCSVCRKTYTETVAPTGHTISDEGTVTKEPGCLTFGIIAYPCLHCDYEETQLLASNGHDYDRGTVTVMPTANAPGTVLYTCLSCGGTKTGSLAFLPGDVNCDGAVTPADLVCLMRHTLGEDVNANTAAGDMNGSGSIELADSLRLVQQLAG